MASSKRQGNGAGQGPAGPPLDLAPSGAAFQLASQWVDAMASELDEATQRELERREQEAAQDWASLGLYTPSASQGQGTGREIKDGRRATKGQRPQRLGLGAVHTPKSAGAEAVEHRLKKRLSHISSEQREEARDRLEGSGTLGAPEDGEGSEEEEEESRAAAFGKEKRKAEAMHDLPHRKKKKKKKKKGHHE